MSNTLRPCSRRIQLCQPNVTGLHCQQTRNATLLKRPKRPYTFTQLVTLTDGSTYMHRTTSPQPVYRATKDIRNSPLWNPSSLKLLNQEEDEAGRLALFRGKYGRGWDAEVKAGQEAEKDAAKKGTDQSDDQGLMDLISMAGSSAKPLTGRVDKIKAVKGKK